MTNFDLITTAEEMAYALINQEYCESCDYNKDGICFFDSDKEDGYVYVACYNAAIGWLMKEDAE